jgi:outer membrane protein OmpA-like peptidoglycan-associated protein
MKTPVLKKYFLYLLFSLACISSLRAQRPLLLNGGFEDINTCIEYKAECGVEGWFYLQGVKAQMLTNNDGPAWLGNNSFALSFKWQGYTGFSPLIGTILPCHLQKGTSYTFKGVIKVSNLNNKLLLKPGIALGEKFYVPRKPFAAAIQPDTITSIKKIDSVQLFRFEYNFVADGREKFLTFGTFIEEEKTGTRKQLLGEQTISVLLDNFELVTDSNQAPCDNYAGNAAALYTYDYRHKEMDYALYAKGDLPVLLKDAAIRTPAPAIPVPAKNIDTLNLGDVFFDFNKASLRPAAIAVLRQFFLRNNEQTTSAIDSIFIEGHTDSIGSDVSNIALSRRRCESIQTWLLQHTIIPATKIHVRPFGRSRPIATNATPAGRALNRRVELVVFSRDDR